MEQFNKGLSFILGLIVVAVFIVVASGKFNIKGFSFPKSTASSKITPTVTPQTTPKPTSKPWFFSTTKVVPTQTNVSKKQDPNYHSYSGSTIPTSIPNTGVPIVLFPLFGTSLITGIFMRKTGKRE